MRSFLGLDNLPTKEEKPVQYAPKIDLVAREKKDKLALAEQSAKALVEAIQDKALSLGWTITQMEELQTRILPCFIPCQIGEMSLQRISIELLNADQSIRGAVTHYNNEVDQSWLKHQAVK